MTLKRLSFKKKSCAVWFWRDFPPLFPLRVFSFVKAKWRFSTTLRKWRKKKKCRKHKSAIGCAITSSESMDFNKVEFNVLSSVLTKSEYPLEPAIMNSYSRLFLQFQRSLFPAPDRVRKWRSVHYANSASLQQTLQWWWWMSNTVYRDMLWYIFFFGIVFIFAH